MRKIIWLTDLHLVEPGHDWPAGVDPLARLQGCLREIRDLHADADRIVISGDLVQLRNPGAYSVLYGELAMLGLPYRLMAGNHDDRTALPATLADAHSDEFRHSAEDIADTRVLYLDTLARDGKHHGELCPVRIQWIADQLAAADNRAALLFLHHPPLEIGVPALDRLRLLDSGPLAELVERRSAPTHLFFGHVHRNVCGLWAGHPFAGLKSTHAQYELDMAGARLVRSNEPPGYGVISFDSDKIVVNFRDVVVAT